MIRTAIAPAAALAAGLLWPALGHAAGGHHAVDDAAILEPGQCEVESWFARAPGGERLLHAGAGCRIGPVELGVAGESARLAGASATGWGAQVKWAMPLSGHFSVGLAVSPAWQAVRPRYQGATAAALATWKASETLALHANLGRDLVHRGRDVSRSGIAAEWTPMDAWSFVAERYVEERTHLLRAGVRWSARDNLSVDFSRARRLSGPGASNWTLGVTWLLER